MRQSKQFICQNLFLVFQNCSIKETQIYNLNGEIETIENVLEHPYEGEMLNIKTSHSIDNLRITPEHPVYVLQGQNKGLNYNIIKNRIEKNLITEKKIIKVKG